MVFPQAKCARDQIAFERAVEWRREVVVRVFRFMYSANPKQHVEAMNYL